METIQERLLDPELANCGFVGVGGGTGVDGGITEFPFGGPRLDEFVCSRQSNDGKERQQEAREGSDMPPFEHNAGIVPVPGKEHIHGARLGHIVAGHIMARHIVASHRVLHVVHYKGKGGNGGTN